MILQVSCKQNGSVILWFCSSQILDSKSGNSTLLYVWCYTELTVLYEKI